MRKLARRLKKEEFQGKWAVSCVSVGLNGVLADTSSAQFKKSSVSTDMDRLAVMSRNLESKSGTLRFTMLYRFPNL